MLGSSNLKIGRNPLGKQKAKQKLQEKLNINEERKQYQENEEMLTQKKKKLSASSYI